MALTVACCSAAAAGSADSADNASTWYRDELDAAAPPCIPCPAGMRWAGAKQRTATPPHASTATQPSHRRAGACCTHSLASLTAERCLLLIDRCLGRTCCELCCPDEQPLLAAELALQQAAEQQPRRGRGSEARHRSATEPRLAAGTTQKREVAAWDLAHIRTRGCSEWPLRVDSCVPMAVPLGQQARRHSTPSLQHAQSGR